MLLYKLTQAHISKASDDTKKRCTYFTDHSSLNIDCMSSATLTRLFKDHYQNHSKVSRAAGMGCKCQASAQCTRAGGCSVLDTRWHIHRDPLEVRTSTLFVRRLQKFRNGPNSSQLTLLAR